MNTTLKRLVSALVAIIMVVFIAEVLRSDVTLGSAQDGVVAQLSTTTLATVGPGVATLFATSSTCTTRVVTTLAQPVMISFDSAFAPTGVRGHLQGASTTVAYDSGLYGCGVWRAASYVSSTTIILSEFR